MFKRTIILSAILILALATACTKKDFIQTTATLGGAAAGALLGGDTQGKIVGALIGAGAGYLIGGWVGDYLTEDEQASLNHEVSQELSQTPVESAGSGKWRSSETPSRTASINYSKESYEPVKTDDSKEEVLSLCRETSISIEKDGKQVGSQKQLWCRNADGDYVPNGEPYAVQTASN